MIGLGFKNFVFRDELHILVGDCNYILLKIPDEIKIFCRKGRIYMLSNSAEKLYNFSAILKRIKKPNFYKGKGILEFKNFKFMKLKIGKKQRFA
jgi:ribosomal protein L6P/L9E